MADGLERLKIQRKTGKEPFFRGEQPLDLTLLHYWQWAHSDLASNIGRGVLAEFIIAHALSLDQTVRDPWQAYDLQTPRGLTLEVKSAAYLQSWWQRGPSAIQFGIQP